jgi:predicted transcriptional regulator
MASMCGAVRRAAPGRWSCQMAEYKIDLDEDLVRMLTELSKKRKLSATEIIKQAVSTEKLISDNVELDKGDELLIKKGDKFKKIVFE